MEQETIVSSDKIFHWTKQENLIKILNERVLRINNCKEDFSSLLNEGIIKELLREDIPIAKESEVLAIPMISFCDLPVSLSGNLQ